MALTIFVVLAAIGFGAAYYTWRHPKFDERGDRTIASSMTRLYSALAGVLSTFLAVSMIDKLLKIYVAPNLFLIERLLNLKK